MTWNIYIYIIRVAYLLQRGKLNSNGSKLIQIKVKNNNTKTNCAEIIFFSMRVFFHGHLRLTGQQGKGGDHLLFHSTTFLAHEHSGIYLELRMYYDYQLFLIAPLVFTRLVLDEIYHLIKIPFG